MRFYNHKSVMKHWHKMTIERCNLSQTSLRLKLKQMESNGRFFIYKNSYKNNFDFTDNYSYGTLAVYFEFSEDLMLVQLSCDLSSPKMSYDDEALAVRKRMLSSFGIPNLANAS